MKRMAIILGSEEYKHYPPTQYCHNDAKLLKEVLVNDCDFAEQDILLKLLTPNNSDSPNGILKEIEHLVASSQLGDTILFYYAGHGAHRDGDSYIVLPSTINNDFAKTALPLRDISKILKKGGRINIRMFDSCHSGQDVRAGDLQFEDFSRDICTGSNEGWLTFAACRYDEYSYSDLVLKHGVFTYYLVETIREYEDNSEIYPEHLKVTVCKKVSEWGDTNDKRQTPTFNAAISGNIAIAKRKIAPENKKLIEVEQKDQPSSSHDIQTRLDSIRAIKNNICNEEHKSLLKEYIEKLAEQFESKQEKINTFGLNLNIGAPVNADEMPDIAKKLIVRKIKSKKFRSFHQIELRIKYEEKTHYLL